MLWFELLVSVLLLKKAYATTGNFGSDGRLGIFSIPKLCDERGFITLPVPGDIFDDDDGDNDPWSLQAGTNRTLCCGAYIKEPLRNDTANISWYYYKSKDMFGSETKPLPSSDRRNITPEHDTHGNVYSFLQVSDITMEDAGLYMCLVSAATRELNPSQPTLQLAKFLKPFIITVYTAELQFESDVDKEPLEMNVNMPVVTLPYKLKNYDPECTLEVDVKADMTKFQYFDIAAEQKVILVAINKDKAVQLNEKVTVAVSCAGKPHSISRDWTIEGWVISVDVLIPDSDDLPPLDMDTPYQFYVVGECGKFDWSLEIDGEKKDLAFDKFDDSDTVQFEDDVKVSYRFIKTGSTDELKKKNLLLELSFTRTEKIYKDIVGVIITTSCKAKDKKVEPFEVRGLPEFDYDDGNCVQKKEPNDPVKTLGPDVVQQFPCCKVRRNYATNLWINGKYAPGDKDKDNEEEAIGILSKNTLSERNKWYKKYVGFYQCFVSGYLQSTDKKYKVKSMMKEFTMNFHLLRASKISASDEQFGHIVDRTSQPTKLTDVSAYITKIQDYVYITLSNTTCMRIKMIGTTYPAGKFTFTSTSGKELYGDETCTESFTPRNDVITFPSYDMVQTTSEIYVLVDKDAYNVTNNVTSTKVDVMFEVHKDRKRSEIEIIPIKPFIEKPRIDRPAGSSITISITCEVIGYPVTDVRLYDKKDRNKGLIGNNTYSYKISPTYTRTGTKVTVDMQVVSNGVYVCSAFNPVTMKTVKAEREIKDIPAPIEPTMIIIAVLAVIILMVVIWFICVCYRKSRYPNAKIKDVFCCVNDPYAPIGNKFELKDPNDKYKVHYDTLNPGRTLGGGHFGIVYEGWSTHLPDRKGEKTTIAIKQVRPCGDQLKREEDLRVERDLMIRVIGHRNVLALYSYTDDPDPVAIILEYAQFGSLDKLLAHARTCKSSGYMMTDEHLDDAIVSFEPTHIINFGKQIAEGMDFIGSKHIVHRDLAARNVVVAGDKSEYILKITDFGLARDVADCDGIYERRIGKEIPIKWTAPESLNDTYTFKSDVWSYGVTLWELCTLGGDPYSGLANSEIRDRLAAGYRLQKPPSCNDDIHDLMMECWQQNPERRPAFKDLVTRFHTYSESPGDYVHTDRLYEGELNLTLKLNHSGVSANGPALRQSSHTSSNGAEAANDYTPSPCLVPDNVTIDPDSELNV